MEIEQFNDEIQIVKQLLDSLTSFKYDSITLYGSAYNKETFEKDLSDIDIIVMSKKFNDYNLNSIVNELKIKNINFREKSPKITIDNLCARIEFYVKFEKISIDVTLCGGLIPNIDELIKNAWYDSFEALMGGVYIYSKTIYGMIPDYELFKEKYYPFYNDELRKKRLKILCEKLEIYNKKIEYNYNIKSTETIDMLIKARKYFIKILFIYYKKYYWSPEKHIYYQLNNFLNLDEETKKILTFSCGDIFECSKKYLNVSKMYLSLIKKEILDNF